ncbi:hypothetical protein ACFWR9_30765 [Streptomyces sp. NPDC058534]|uniref:hypothetical protein n=1 Tax=Streptomyces sp. NPDC058534 TaxID=3346541 RepID=UPI003658DA24
MQLLPGDRHLSRTIDQPSRLGVSRCLAPPGGVADSGTHKAPDDEGRRADSNYVAVLVAPITGGSPGRALTGTDSKGKVPAFQARRRGDQRAASKTTCQEIRDDLA